MIDDFLEVSSCSEPTGLIFVKQFKDNVNKFITVVDLVLLLIWEHNPGLPNFEEQKFPFPIIEWSYSDQHFVDKYT